MGMLNKIKLFLPGLGRFSIMVILFSVNTIRATDEDLGSGGVGGILTNITNNMQDIGALTVSVGFVAGIAFFIAAIFKFKAHRDAPQQNPVGTPFTLLICGVALVFLPTLISSGGATLFGSSDVEKAGYSGRFS